MFGSDWPVCKLAGAEHSQVGGGRGCHWSSHYCLIVIISAGGHIAGRDTGLVRGLQGGEGSHLQGECTSDLQAGCLNLKTTTTRDLSDLLNIIILCQKI